MINASKIPVFLASLTADIIGFIWLKIFGKPVAADTDMDTMEFAENTPLPRSGLPL